MESLTLIVRRGADDIRVMLQLNCRHRIREPCAKFQFQSHSLPVQLITIRSRKKVSVLVGEVS